MPIVLLGESGGGVPFGRSFFNSSFDLLVQKMGKESARKLTLYLSDGTFFDVSQIEELAENYMVVRGYRGEAETDTQAVNLLPYGLIYRIELNAKPESTTRVGFKWVPPSREHATATPTRKKS